MTEQNFVYVDADYLKELEETAKKVDYYKGVIDGIMMCKTENSSEKPNNSTSSKMEQVEDEQQTELVRVKYHCINCAENGSYKCSKCDGEMYYKYDKDEPQTERVHIVMYEPTNAEILARLDAKDEPQTDCAWK